MMFKSMTISSIQSTVLAISGDFVNRENSERDSFPRERRSNLREGHRCVPTLYIGPAVHMLYIHCTQDPFQCCTQDPVQTLYIGPASKRCTQDPPLPRLPRPRPRRKFLASVAAVPFNLFNKVAQNSVTTLETGRELVPFNLFNKDFPNRLLKIVDTQKQRQIFVGEEKQFSSVSEGQLEESETRASHSCQTAPISQFILLFNFSVFGLPIPLYYPDTCKSGRQCLSGEQDGFREQALKFFPSTVNSVTGQICPVFLGDKYERKKLRFGRSL